MTAPAPHETPMADRNLAWDWSEHGARYTDELIELGGWKAMAAAHAWFDGPDTGDPPERKSDYKLPHHRAIGSETRVVLEGVRSAVNILAAARFQPDKYQLHLPAEDVPAVYEHLATHLRQFGEDPPDILKGWAPADGWPPRG